MIDLNAQWQLNRDAQMCSADEKGQSLVSIDSVVDAALWEVRTCMPGTIDTFDAATQTAQVRPGVQRIAGRDYEEGQFVDIPPLMNVPVLMLHGAGYAITFPIEAGDQCLIFFADRAVDTWRASGGSVEPSRLRHHSLCDGFALVGLRSNDKAIENFNTDALELRSADGQTRIRIDNNGRIDLDQSGNHVEMNGNEIKLTASTVRIDGQLAVSGSITAQGNVTGGGISLQSHVHPGVQSGGSVTGTPQ